LFVFLHSFHVSSSQAFAADVLWFGCMVVVSMLGAPAFAVGNRTHSPVTPEPV
jgi:hypothetical protein